MQWQLICDKANLLNVKEWLRYRGTILAVSHRRSWMTMYPNKVFVFFKEHQNVNLNHKDFEQIGCIEANLLQP